MKEYAWKMVISQRVVLTSLCIRLKSLISFLFCPFIRIIPRTWSYANFRMKKVWQACYHLLWDWYRKKMEICWWKTSEQLDIINNYILKSVIWCFIFIPTWFIHFLVKMELESTEINEEDPFWSYYKSIFIIYN